MRGTARTVAVVAGVSTLTLLAAACGGGNSSSDTSSSAAGKTGGTVTVRGCNPQNPLIPSNTTETCGGNVLDAITAKLVHYNPENAAPENDIADKIETTDNQNFTITLKKGYKFQDGTEVKSKNFIDAWNYAAYGPNAQSSGYFMEPIEGFGDMQCTDDACKAKPKADKLTGLVAKDDYTFTIKTTEKVSNMPVRLGYSAFAPLPDSFFSDPKAYGEKPIGAGPCARFTGSSGAGSTACGVGAGGGTPLDVPRSSGKSAHRRCARPARGWETTTSRRTLGGA